MNTHLTEQQIKEIEEFIEELKEDDDLEYLKLTEKRYAWLKAQPEEFFHGLGKVSGLGMLPYAPKELAAGMKYLGN